MIQIKRVYETAEKTDGARFLVDRLWPRGIKKEALAIREWLKDVAPSNELRHWYHHDISQWDEFRRRYFDELKQHPGAWLPLVEAAGKRTITLLYGSKHTEHNNAVALKEFLNDRLLEKKETLIKRHVMTARARGSPAGPGGQARSGTKPAQ